MSKEENKKSSVLEEVLQQRKELDTAKKKAQNRKKAFSEKIVSYLDSRKTGNFDFLAPPGCVVQLESPDKAEVLVSEGLYHYLEVDKKNKLPNVEIDSAGRAIYTYKCNKKRGDSGALATEQYVILYCPREDYEYFHDMKAEYTSRVSDQRQEEEVEKGLRERGIIE